MELDLEEQWNKAFEAKRTGRIDAGRPVKGMELLWKVTDPSYVGTAAENWNERIVKAIRLEKAEAAKKYNIVFGQTEIYCARCGKSWGFGNHTCADIRLQNLNEAKAIKNAELTPELCNRIKVIGQRKVAVKLALDHHTVSTWIRKRSVPLKYHKSIIGL